MSIFVFESDGECVDGFGHVLKNSNICSDSRTFSTECLCVFLCQSFIGG